MGALVADTLTADLTHYPNGVIQNTWDRVSSFRGVSEGDMTRFALERKEPLLAEHEAFRDSVRGLRDNVVSLEDGVTTLVVAEAALESARTGQTVTLG